MPPEAPSRWLVDRLGVKDSVSSISAMLALRLRATTQACFAAASTASRGTMSAFTNTVPVPRSSSSSSPSSGAGSSGSDCNNRAAAG